MYRYAIAHNHNYYGIMEHYFSISGGKIKLWTLDSLSLNYKYKKEKFSNV